MMYVDENQRKIWGGADSGLWVTSLPTSQQQQQEQQQQQSEIVANVDSTSRVNSSSFSSTSSDVLLSHSPSYEYETPTPWRRASDEHSLGSCSSSDCDDVLIQGTLRELQIQSTPIEKSSISSVNNNNKSEVALFRPSEVNSSSDFTEFRTQRINTMTVSISSSSSSVSSSDVYSSSLSTGSPLSPLSSSSLSLSAVSVFVGRLPFELGDDEFSGVLNKAYRPLECCICMNKRKKSKGFGFVRFQTMQDAQYFVEQANRAFIFPGQKLPLRVEICHR